VTQAAAAGALGSPFATGGIAVVREIHVLLGCASDVNRYRKIGRDVIERTNQMFTYGHPAPVRAIQWEYTQDIPGMSPRGDVAGRSRDIVGMTHLVAVILGPRLGDVTKEEVRSALQYRRDGIPKELLLFRWAGRSDSSYKQLCDEVIKDFDEDPRWTTFRSPLDFQGLFFTSLIPHMLRVVSPSYTPVIGAPAA